MGRLALQHFAAADRPNEFPIAHGYFAAHRNQVRAPLDFPAFERAVIDVHLLGRRRDLSAILRIVNDQVRIRTDLDRAFAREEPESLRRIRTRDVDERMEVELPSLYA